MLPDPTLQALGFTPFFSNQPTLNAPPTIPARVLSQQGPDLFRVATARGELLAEPAGHLRRRPPDPLAVGDWLHVVPRDDGRATIHGRFRRTGTLARRSAGSHVRQIIAANVDTVFLVTSANRDLNPRRLERYLTAAWDGGTEPVVVVTKIDLHAAPEDLVDVLSHVAAGVPVHLVCALDSVGLEPLKAYLTLGRTVALVGSSGVGKSTLVNRLLGREAQATLPIREGDDRGRHTTTSRDLLRLPEGGNLIDTPGMRELGLLGGDEGLERAFPEILALANQCRFRDCAHQAEPGCAIQSALASGALSQQRLTSWQKLGREQARAAIKEDGLARSQLRKARRRQSREYRRRSRSKEKNR